MEEENWISQQPSLAILHRVKYPTPMSDRLRCIQRPNNDASLEWHFVSNADYVKDISVQLVLSNRTMIHAASYFIM